MGIGLDAGEAVPVDGGYRGGALNLAARLCSLAESGEVLASREVAHLARKVEGVKYGERGAIRLKGLTEPVPVVTVRPEFEDLTQNVAFRRALGPLAVALAKGETRNPYKGLRAFEEADAADFFGREALSEHLVERLRVTRFLAVVGPSGSGKSSVVRAGLVPALRRGALEGSDRWPVVHMFPGAYPVEELEAALLKIGDNPPSSLIEQLEDGERGLVRALKRVLRDDASELVLVLDQLEEVFTLVEDEQRRAHFLAILERAVLDPHSRLRVVTTLRADFYDRPLLYSGFAELLRDYVEAVVPLTPDEFERAIAGPAERVGATLEPGLLAEMVADVAHEPGALPLLQYALTELYEHREGNVLTREAYRAIGGVSGALARRAEEIYLGLGEAAQGATRQLFLRLVTLGEGAEDTRRRVERRELAMEVDQEALDETIDAFGSSRLLSFDRDPRSGTPTVEVAHEALLREWARLRRWIEAAREDVRMHRRLASGAREWEESGRDSSFVLRGSQLAQFDALVDDSRLALTHLERAFVTASRAESERELLRERRENRRLKVLLAGAGLLLALAIAAGVLALLQRQSAQREATVALARELGARAVIEPRIDRAMLLASQAVDLNGSAQTAGTLLATLLRSPAATGTFTLPIGVRPCCSMSLSPDGRTLAVPDNAGQVRFIDTRTRRVREVVPNFGYGVAPTFSADSSLLVGQGGSSTPRVDLLDARTFARVRSVDYDKRWLSVPTRNDVPMLMTRDKRTLYFVYALVDERDQTGATYVDRWNLATGKLVSTKRARTGAADAVFAANERQIAIAGTRAVTFVDAKTLQTLRSFPVPDSEGGPVALSAGARTLAIGSRTGTLSLVDVESGRVTRSAGGHGVPVAQLDFSPDGRTLVSTAEDGSVIEWDAANAEPLEHLRGHASRPLGIAFSKDARTLYTSSLDGAVFEWDLGTSRRFGVPFRTSPPSELGPFANAPPLALSPDGKKFAVRVGTSNVALYSTASPRRLALIESGSRKVDAVAWSAAGELAVTGDNGHVASWQARDKPRLVRSFQGLRSVNKQPEAVTAAAFSPDGALLAAADINEVPRKPPLGTIAVWETRTGELLWKKASEGGVSAVAFAPDGKTLAVARDNATVVLHEAQGGAPQRTLHPAGEGWMTVSYAPNGTVATGTWAGIVQLWNPETGSEIGRPTLVATAPVASISFSPSGDEFATAGGSDGLVKLWVTETRQQFGATFPGDPGQWGAALHTPDGSKLVVVYEDGTGFIWPVSLRAWQDHACAVAGRNLTREEWSRFVGDRDYSTVCPP